MTCHQYLSYQTGQVLNIMRLRVLLGLLLVCIGALGAAADRCAPPSLSVHCGDLEGIVSKISIESGDADVGAILAALDAEMVGEDASRAACRESVRVAACYSTFVPCESSVLACSTLLEDALSICQGPPFVVDEDVIHDILRLDHFASCDCVPSAQSTPCPSATPEQPTLPPTPTPSHSPLPTCPPSAFSSTWSSCDASGLRSLVLSLPSWELPPCDDADALNGTFFTAPCRCDDGSLPTFLFVSPCGSDEQVVIPYVGNDISCDGLPVNGAVPRGPCNTEPSPSASFAVIGPGAVDNIQLLNATCAPLDCLWNERPEGGNFEGMAYQNCTVPSDAPCTGWSIEAGAQSASIGHVPAGHAATLTLTVNATGEDAAAFMLISCVAEAHFDGIDVMVDGHVVKEGLWNVSAGGLHVPLGSLGEHTLSWVFRKDASGTADGEMARIDALYLVDAVPLLNQPSLPEEPTTSPEEPTQEPTQEPTIPPTEEPTVPPTEEPTVPPTEEPTVPPTQGPTLPPTQMPTTQIPTVPTVPPTQARPAGEQMDLGNADKMQAESAVLLSYSFCFMVIAMSCILLVSRYVTHTTQEASATSDILSAI